jgi:class 3 adenylate cyclase/tetratricopeptide (TPR) repeat protein
VTNQPGGTLTILFTDLVGSTSLGDALGDQQAQKLRRAHDRILRQQFDRFAAEVIKGTGDGFMVTFSSARQAVECAVEIQRALADAHAAGRYRELSVRAGLHTGEPVRDSGDIYGIDVDMAARVSSEAAGGEILVSEVTRLLARQSIGLEFVALGERSLKGFAEPVALYAVRWPDQRVARPRMTNFVGRDSELQLLRDRLLDTERGRGRVMLIAGEPGVGKTRLASELAIEAADRGFSVLIGRAEESEEMPPYLPFAEALTQYVRQLDRDLLTTTLGDRAPLIAKLVPQLRAQLTDLEEPPTLSPEADRHRLFEGVKGLLSSIAGQTPVLLFLDDLHWADRASLLLLLHLSRGIEEVGVMIIGTFRDDDVDDAHPLAALRAELARRHNGACITLAPFDRAHAEALIAAVLGHPASPAVVDGIFSASEGNPFFTEELVRDLQDQGSDVAAAGFDSSGLPEGVRQVISRRLARLSSESSRVLAHASVLGRALWLPSVAAVTGEDEASTLDLLDEALAAGLLRDGENGGYIYAHALIHETLYRGLSGARRRQLHRRAAEELERRAGQHPEPAQLMELAHHYFRASSVGEMTEAIHYATLAADAAIGQLAYEEAVRLYRMALDALAGEEHADLARRCRLLLALAEAQSRTGEGAQAVEAFLEAGSIAKELSDGQLLARAALGYGDIRRNAGFVDESLINILTEALDALPTEDSPLRAKVIARLAAALYHAASHDRMKTLSWQAVEMARRLGDTETLVYVLGTDHFYLTDLMDNESRIAAADELIRLADSIGYREMALRARRWKIVDLLELGKIAEVDGELDDFARLAEESKHATYRWDAAVCYAMRAILDGRYAEGEALMERALEIGRNAQGQTFVAALFYQIQLFRLRRQQGRLVELEEGTKAFVSRYAALPGRVALGLLYAELGRIDEAREELRKVAAQDFADLTEDYNLPAALTQLADLVSSVGDAERAGQLYDRLLPHDGRVAMQGATADSNGAVARYLGLLAATLGRWDDAERHFLSALAMHQRMGALPLLAHTQHDYAVMLMRRNAPGDAGTAGQLHAEASSTATRLGMQPFPPLSVNRSTVITDQQD